MLQRGLIGALRLDGPVLPHEGVIPEVVEDRAALMRAAAANFEPLLLSYRGQGTATGATAVIERTRAAPPRCWPPPPRTASRTACGRSPTPPTSRAIDADLAGRQALIADGHHRWATYQRLYEQQPGATAASPWASGLVLLVDTARYPLQVRAIHRVLPHLPPAKALADLAGAFRARRLPGDLPAALEALEETPGTAFVLAGGPDSFHLLDRPDPGCSTVRSAGTGPRPGGGWTPRCCTPSCWTRSGTSPTTRRTSAICITPGPPSNRPPGTAVRPS